eukprot:5630267-Prymnesium_polylepis.1
MRCGWRTLDCGRTLPVASVQDLSHLLSGSTPPPQRARTLGGCLGQAARALMRAAQPDRRERTEVHVCVRRRGSMRGRGLERSGAGL